MGNPTINMPDAMLNAVDRQPGINRSGWVRGAVERRLYADKAADEVAEELPEDWWREAVDEYLNSLESASIEAETTA